MTAYPLASLVNRDTLTGKTGGDTFTITAKDAGLILDGDTRQELNSTTSTSLGSFTQSGSFGGKFIAEARYVQYITYTGGTGNVPALGSVISQGGASGKLIGVQASLTSVFTASGSAMPATGIIKIKAWNSVTYTSGALTGISATASGPSTLGTLEIVGDEASTITMVKLGLTDFRGEPYLLGTTNGTANQTFQVPTNGLTRYIAGVWIEKSVGSGAEETEFYASAGSQTAVSADIRGKLVWCTTAGLVRLGHNGTANAGYTPPAGLKVYIGNIFLENCTTAARTANVLPNVTLATRYDFTTTGAGIVKMRWVNSAWYISCAQAYSVELDHVGALEQILISEPATPLIVTAGVGQTAAQSQVGLSLAICPAGGVFTDCHFTRATLATSGFYTVTTTDTEGITYNNCIITGLSLKGNATTGNWLDTRSVGCVWNDLKLVNGRIVWVTSTNPKVNSWKYCDVITGTTTTTAVQNSYIFEPQSNTIGLEIGSGDFFELTNVQPYLGIQNIAAAGCRNLKIRNIGTATTPRDLGATNGGAYLAVLATGASSGNVKIQRCYVSNTRTGLITGDNSSTNITMENSGGDYADAPVFPMLNFIGKGLRCTPPLTAQVSCYGTHFIDTFISATVGWLCILMNEKTNIEPSASSYQILAGTPQFTSAGSLVMGTIGDSIEWTFPYYALGHTAFANSAPIMAGGTIGNYNLQYQIDKNDGAGYGTLKTLSGANLSAETGIDASKGVKMKVRITTTTTNTGGITSLYMITASTAIAQAGYQYPLDVSILTFTGLISGTQVDAYTGVPGSGSINIGNTNTSGSSFGFTHSSGGIFGYVTFVKEGYQTLTITLTYSAADTEIPIQQIVDPVFIS